MKFERIDQEFITRCNVLFKEEGLANLEKRRKSIEKWNNENREKLRRCQRDYAKSEKGIQAGRKSSAIHNRRIRKLALLLDEQEKEAIRLFYVNCPPGYEVDHIIPISKGGRHHISNLQYLTKMENRQKSKKLDWKRPSENHTGNP